MNRSFEAVHYFSELQTIVQNCFPGFDIILKLPGSDDIVASQEELFFAYCDKAEEAPVLKLDLFLSKSLSKKRKQRDDEAEVANSRIKQRDDVVPEVVANRRIGPWQNGEIELFKAGVKVQSKINTRNSAGENGPEFPNYWKLEMQSKSKNSRPRLWVLDTNHHVF